MITEETRDRLSQERTTLVDKRCAMIYAFWLTESSSPREAQLKDELDNLDARIKELEQSIY